MQQRIAGKANFLLQAAEAVQIFWFPKTVWVWFEKKTPGDHSFFPTLQVGLFWHPSPFEEAELEETESNFWDDANEQLGRWLMRERL